MIFKILLVTSFLGLVNFNGFVRAVESKGIDNVNGRAINFNQGIGLQIGGNKFEFGIGGSLGLLGSKGSSTNNNAKKKVEAGACFAWSDAHYKTFDGHVFSFDSNCAFTLLKDNRDLFTVTVQNDPLCQQNATCPRMLRLFVQDNQYDLASNPITRLPELRKDKKVVPVPSQLPDLRVEAESGQFLAVSLDTLGLKIKWDGEKIIQIEASESLWNRTAGLCGTLNGDRNDDYGFGTKTSLHAVNLWKIDDIGEKCEEYPNKQNPCGMDNNLDREADEFCTKLLSDKRYNSCINLVDTAGFQAACKWDYCSCKKVDPKTCACDTMDVYVRQCAHKGLVDLTGWRDNKVCPMECTNGRIYMTCGPENQETCATDFSGNNTRVTGSRCEEGCFCPIGTILHEGRCIQRTECPCRLHGKSYKSGETVPKDCNNCTCQAGQWNCSEMKCSARCSAIGDPHYTTFDGKRYDFMGTCSYYLVKGDNYSIEAENSPCTNFIPEMMGFTRSYKDGDPSCTKTVTIRVNNVAVKLKQNRQILVNGEDVTNLPILAGGMRIRIVSSIFIAVELPNGLQVLWDGVSRVYVNAPPQFRDQTKGLCGTFNANQKDDFLTPDGDVEKAVVPFANKWKTNEHCANIKREADHPCNANMHKKDAAEKFCSVLKKKIFLGCHWHVDPEPFYKDCLYDMCACDDKIENCLCPTLAAYAKDCAHSGVEIPWRYEVKECRVHCPGDQEYQVCGSSCKRSCADISSLEDCKEECVEGCNCPKGQTLDVNGDCIPISQCPCTNNGLEFPAGYKEIRPGTKGQDLCTCASGVWSCRPATDKEKEKYPEIPKLKTLCDASKHQELTTCEPVEQRTCSNMHQHVSQSPAICRPACVCKAGYVLDAPSGECVPENQCPCYHGGRSYKEDDFRQKECNTCRCTQGKWDCTDTPCPGVCSVWGDSHYKTFDDKLFSFQGACEYVLAKGKLSDDESFDVTVRNVPCGTTGVTCSKSITLTIGKNSHAPEEKITLTRGKSLAVEDFQNLQRIAVRRAGLFVFLDIPDLGLVLQWDEGTRVYVRLDAKWKGHTKGLCGDFNDNAEDDFKTPSGGLSEASASIFGDSWKLSELCAEPDEKSPDTCAQRPERKLWATQKCKIMSSPIFEACHSEVPPDEYIERCIYDACGCDEGGDCECLCTAIAAYAQECNAMGVPIHWRSQKLCPMQCDESCSKYSSCITTCPRETCDNLVTRGDSLHLCDQDTCVDGCKPKVCPEGQIYLNSSYSECVPRASCKPVCMVINGVIYYEGDKIRGDDCHSCFCSRGKEVCKGLPCDDGKCKSGWTSWWNKDRPKDNGFRNEIEKIPSLTQLLNSNSSAYCDKDMIDNIECRKANTTLSHKKVGLNVDCSIDTGFTCRLSDNPGKNCPDFEIRVHCQCKDVLLPPPPLCELNAVRSNPSNCLGFFRCEVGPSGYNKWMAKTCPPSKMFNDKTNDCDWSANVQIVRPECQDITITTTPDPRCQPGEHWNDCAIKCSRTCHSYNNLLTMTNKCYRTIDCMPGCVSDLQTDCKGNDNYWLNENTCVDRSHCTCATETGQLVAPGDIVKVSDCKTCQCLNNYYICNDNCSNQTYPEPCIFKPPTTYDFPDVLLVPHVSSPPGDCPNKNYIRLIEQFSFGVTFSSSVFSLLTDDMMRVQSEATPLLWQPLPEDKQPWLQIELKKPQPIYGIAVGGDPNNDTFVTSYYVLYSNDGHKFSTIDSITEKPYKFHGPAESHKSEEQFFNPPIEAKFLRVYPVNCHTSISMHIELIVCGDDQTTLTTTPDPSIKVVTVCDDLMGYDNGLMSQHQVTVSSTHDMKQPDLRLSTQQDIWHPFTDSPNQYVQFDFLEPRNLTGIETKGGDGSWVKQYTVKYSKDGRIWSSIVDKLGAEKKFLANVDDHSSHINYFDMPISATLLRIYPNLWYKRIGMRVEIRGCYLPYPPTTPPPVGPKPPPNCQVCPNTRVKDKCTCEGSLWWDGLKCVPRQNCPCVVNGVSYPVGSTYETSNCQKCTCSMGGYGECSPKTCPACANPGQRPVVSELCACLCKSCPTGQKLCPTDGVCIDENKWCDGFKNCFDDESDICKPKPPPEPPKKYVEECVTTCPPGYVRVDNTFDTMLYNSGATITQNNTNLSIAWKKNLPPPKCDCDNNPTEPHYCPPIICRSEDCKGCPAEFHLICDQTTSIRKKRECDNCISKPPKVRVCRMFGKSFSSFDGLYYEYDICDHVLARAMIDNGWAITVKKVCEDKNMYCQNILTISIDNHLVILRPDMYVTIDGRHYNPSEVKRLSDKNPAMKISRVGNSLRFESEIYSFWALLDTSGIIKIGVSDKFIGRVNGLCGYFDGNESNDKQKPTLEIAKNTEEFGDSWKTLNGLQCKSQVCPKEMQTKSLEVCSLVRESSFEACSKVLDRERFISNCMETHCACMTSGNFTAQQCRCDALSTYVSKCLAADSSIDLSNWRPLYDCPAVCEAPFVWKDCFRQKRELSCENLLDFHPYPNFDDDCVQGCFCPDGMVRRGDTCVPPAECRDCVCDGLGHSRYVTFDRKNLLFNGICTYLLSRDVGMTPNSEHAYQVFVTNGACEEGICTESITVFYGRHVIQMRKGSKPHQLVTLVDSQEVANYPLETPWFTIGMTPSRDVQLLIPEIQLEIIAFKQNLEFVLRLPSQLFGWFMEGLCGNCNGRPNDDFKKYDGLLTNDQQEFGNSWAAKNLADFPKLNLNLDNEQCTDKPLKPCTEQPSTNDYCAQLFNDDRFARCHGIVDPTPYYYACKNSLCQGENTCADFEAYARMCTMNGACIDWRTPQRCPYECRDQLEYEACGTGYAQTCKTIENPIQFIANPVEGCVCPLGHVLQNNTCVPERNCFACDAEGHLDGDKWYPDKCTKCTCNNRQISCTFDSCPAVSTICDENSNAEMVRGTEKNCCPKYFCVPGKPPVSGCDEREKPQCGFAQTLKVTTDAKGCQKYICECVPKDQCSSYKDDDSNSQILEPGYVMIVDLSGCCPIEKPVCKPETCPPVEKCQKYQNAVNVAKPNACCQQVICERLKDRCIYNLDSSNEITYLDKVVAKKIGDIWQDGLCKTCKCELNDGTPTANCFTKQCIKLEDHPDFSDYDLWNSTSESECCPKFTRSACKDHNIVYKVGQEWHPKPNDSCVVTECVEDLDGLRKNTFTNVCRKHCELGYKYEESQDRSVSCCGECKPYACVIDGQLKNVGEIWYSNNFCQKNICEMKNGSLYVRAESESCELVNPLDDLDYNIELKPEPGKCCPKICRTGCRANGLVYKPGSSWKNPEDSCILESCVQTPDGQIIKHKEHKTCNMDCPKGWEYQKSKDPNVCCGECKQMYCIVDDHTYKPGQTWHSKDNCTEYSCTQKIDQLIVSISSQVCPRIDCPPQNVYHDGCCKRCNFTSHNITSSCTAKLFNVADTIGLIREKNKSNGLCKNLKTIAGLAECNGNCKSLTYYDDAWNTVSDCSCCQPSKDKKISVELTCDNGTKYKKVITVPTECSCEACSSGGRKRSKHQSLEQLLQKYREEDKRRKS